MDNLEKFSKNITRRLHDIFVSKQELCDLDGKLNTINVVNDDINKLKYTQIDGTENDLGRFARLSDDSGTLFMGRNIKYDTVNYPFDTKQSRVLVKELGRLIINKGRDFGVTNIEGTQVQANGKLIVVADSNQALATDANVLTISGSTIKLKRGSGDVDSISLPVTAAPVYTNNLTTNTTGTALDAKQGKVLQDTKVAKTSNQALSAAGDALTISGSKITLNRGDGTTDVVTLPTGAAPTTVVDNLSSTQTSSALSSNQGRILNNTKEDDLGNPSVDGSVLTSTVAGVRSWTTPNVIGTY